MFEPIEAVERIFGPLREEKIKIENYFDWISFKYEFGSYF